MGLFSDLMGRIFHGGSAGAQRTQGAPLGQPSTQPSNPTGGGASPQAQAAAPVDVAAILNKMASENPQKLDWKRSIVDLMKLVGMDSSLNARRELAADLHYSGDTGDTATMNMWLHKEVMKRLAENGGKVPQDLLSR